MKKLLLCSVLIVLSFSTARAQSLVNTTWAFHWPDDALFRYFRFSDDTLYWSSDNVSYTGHSLITFAGQAMTISDLLGADMGCPTANVGNYTFEVVNDTLDFDLVNDPCTPRGQIMDEGYGVQAPSGIVDAFSAVGISVFPNPATNGSFHLRIPAAAAAYNSLRLVGMDGRLVAQQNLPVGAAVDRDVFLATPATGTYLLILSGPTRTVTTKLMVATP